MLTIFARMRTFKTKDISLQIKDMDMSKGQVQMYVSAFGNKDAHGDIIVKGAYKKTLTENSHRIKHLWQHDPTNVIGKPKSMVEDNQGLLVDSFISDIKNGDYRKLYEDGIITEHSVGFLTMNENFNKAEDVNYMTELKLYEFSSVTWGANENTPVVGMKSLTEQDKKDLFTRFDKLTKALRNGTYTDDTFQLIEIETEQIKAQIKSALHEPRIALESKEPLEFDITKFYRTLN